MGPPNFGPGHRPGLLLRARPGEDVANLPARSGIAVCSRRHLPPPMLSCDAACPLPVPEPLGAVAHDARAALAARQAQRAVDADAGILVNRLVYDSLQEPPEPGEQQTLAASPQQAPGQVRARDSTASTSSEAVSSGGASEHPATRPAAITCSGSGQSSSGQHDAAVDVNQHQLLPSWYTLASPDDTTLLFESRFECGNLRRAVQVR